MIYKVFYGGERMSYIKRQLEDIMVSMTLEERIEYLVDECDWSYEAAEECALLYEPIENTI